MTNGEQRQSRKGANSHKTLRATESRVRVRLSVTLNGIVNAFPMLNSGSGGVVHSTVSHVLKSQPINAADSSYRKSAAYDVNILFILDLKSDFKRIQDVLRRVKI